MLMHHSHVPVHICAISITWNFHTDPYCTIPEKQQVETTS
jgi:hypothetical protein